jgi:hypothetical protein
MTNNFIRNNNVGISRNVAFLASVEIGRLVEQIFERAA